MCEVVQFICRAVGELDSFNPFHFRKRARGKIIEEKRKEKNMTTCGEVVEWLLKMNPLTLFHFMKRSEKRERV